MKRIQEWVSRQAERRPESPAVVTEAGAITYAELEETSNRIARMLRAIGCERGDRVVLLLGTSPTAIASILGTLKADAAYVPVDPRSPAVRAAKMIRACEPRVILAEGATASLARGIAAEGVYNDSTRIGWMEAKDVEKKIPVDFTLRDVDELPADAPPASNSPDALAYILFTSGSTGRPKGVAITHANVAHFVTWAVAYFGIEPSDRASGHAPLHFDLSTFDLFGTFAAGARLYPVPRGLNLLPRQLADWIRANELTQWFSVPSVLSYLAKFDAVRPNDFSALRRLIWCGEVFPTPALIHWMERLPHVSFTNLYGPTETTVASSYYTIPTVPQDSRADIPIGRPCAGEELVVLDEDLRPIEPGVVGELYIRGVGLGRGYWRDEEQTRAAFVPDPLDDPVDGRLYRTGDLARMDADGLVYFIGREDAMIKSRGYRIELGEIENALYEVEGLGELAVAGIPTDGFEGTTIACAFTALPGTDIAPHQLRKSLSRTLPDYMIPSRWLRLRRLPKNANGKIDRRRIRELLRTSCN